MSSKEIAELTGKELGHIHRDIRTMLDDLAGEDDPDLEHVHFERDARAYTIAIYLPKSLSITLVAGYNVVLRNRIIRRWLDVEAKQAPDLPRIDMHAGKSLRRINTLGQLSTGYSHRQGV